jgi:hypothetical protein
MPFMNLIGYGLLARSILFNLNYLGDAKLTMLILLCVADKAVRFFRGPIGVRSSTLNRL